MFVLLSVLSGSLLPSGCLVDTAGWFELKHQPSRKSDVSHVWCSFKVVVGQSELKLARTSIVSLGFFLEAWDVALFVPI